MSLQSFPIIFVEKLPWGFHGDATDMGNEFQIKRTSQAKMYH